LSNRFLSTYFWAAWSIFSRSGANDFFASEITDVFRSSKIAATIP
jgi:hypothetical protein